MSIGENIKRLREQNGMSQDQLAELVRNETGRKSSKFISNWETGLNKPDADTIMVLAKIFNVDVNTIFGWEKKDAQNVANGLTDKISSLSAKDKEFIKDMIERMGK
jgi:transcriptional regulator with XRE-family HTH domain